MATRKRKKKEEVIIILQAEVNDYAVAELKTAEDGDKVLHGYILAYKEALENEGKEVFEVFGYFLVSEDGIYIALYEDEARELGNDE